MSRVEIVNCRVRHRKSRMEILPERPIRLHPGDRTERVAQDGRVSIVIYRAGPWRRFWLKLRGRI